MPFAQTPSVRGIVHATLVMLVTVRHALMPMNVPWARTSVVLTPRAPTTLARTAALATLATQAMAESVWMSTSVFSERIDAAAMRLATTQLDRTVAPATPVIVATASRARMSTNALESTCAMRMRLAPTPSARIRAAAILVLHGMEVLVSIIMSAHWELTIAVSIQHAPTPSVHSVVRARRVSKVTATLAMSSMSACTATIAIPMQHASTPMAHTIACV